MDTSNEVMRDHETMNRGGSIEMPSTSGTVIDGLQARGVAREVALEQFARKYWQAVYAFVRMNRYPPAEAEDLTQSFLLSLIEKESFDGFIASRGRFRTWLLASLKNHLCNDWRRKRQKKRGGGAIHLSIDRDLGEAWLKASAVDEDRPDLIFQKRWIAGIIERSIDRLAAHCRENGREDHAEVLVPMIAADETRGYADAAAKLGISPSNARVATYRLRLKLRELIRDEIADTVASPEEVEAEMNELFGYLKPAGQG